MPEPRFSIVIPTHNYGHMVGIAIESVLLQGRDDVEIFVIDDASTDETAEVVSRYAEDVTYVRLEENVGPALAWQMGLERAGGEFVCKLDADDWQLPHYMDTVEAAFRSHDNVGLVTGSVLITREGEDIAHMKPIRAPDGLMGPDDFRRRLLDRYFFHMPSVAARRDAVVDHLPIRADLRMPHDWEFFLRSMKGWSCFVWEKPLAVYRIHKGSLTRTGRERALRRDMENLMALTADPEDPAYLEPSERRRFARAVATTYLLVIGQSIRPYDVAGVLSELRFALDLAAQHGRHIAASVAWQAAALTVERGFRSFLQALRSGIPLTAVLPGGSMWADDGSYDRSDEAPDSATGG